MHSALIGLLLLLAQIPDVPDVGQRVIAELRNGYRIEGVLIEKDHRSAVLSLESGELRLDLRRVSRFHLPEPPSETKEKPAPRTREVSLRVSSTTTGERRLIFSVPETWKQIEGEAAILDYVAPREELWFRVEDSTMPQSLWKITAKIRRSYAETLTGFEVKQERFGNRWEGTRTWEIDFEFDEGGTRYRERRLHLDFGDRMSVFVFRTRASSFPSLVGHFERITSGLALEDAAATEALPGGALPGAGGPRPGDSSAGDPKRSGSTKGDPKRRDPKAGDLETGAGKLRLEDLEQALEAEIREALQAPAVEAPEEG